MLPDDVSVIFFDTEYVWDIVEKLHGITYSQKMLSEGGIV